MGQESHPLNEKEDMTAPRSGQEVFYCRYERDSTAGGIWEGLDHTGPREEKEVGRSREEEKREGGEDKQTKRGASDQETKRSKVSQPGAKRPRGREETRKDQES